VEKPGSLVFVLFGVSECKRNSCLDEADLSYHKKRVQILKQLNAGVQVLITVVIMKCYISSGL
jgi:hypothetical protein